MLTKTAKIFLLSGAIAGAFTIIIGAFGAHSASNILNSNTMAMFETGVKYQGLHSLALLFTGLIMKQNIVTFKFSGWFFIIGIFGFSGGLYIFSMSSYSWIHVFIPLGGTAFLLGWIFLAIGIFQLK
tara:strand:- start:113 stop:493 length:381 start_codon:yes stop_codon:yes gene_type:complete